MENGNSDSSSDDDGVVDETDDVELQRCRRSAEGTETGGDASEQRTSETVRSLRQANFGNPPLGPRMQLYSRTGFFLGVFPDGTVHGTQDPNDIYTHLELTNAGYPGHVRIRGLETLLYVAMNKKGRLYAERNMWKEATVFVESLDRYYNNYLSRAHAHVGWYLGIKKSGKSKKGPMTKFRQKAVQFLPVRKKFE